MSVSKSALIFISALFAIALIISGVFSVFLKKPLHAQEASPTLSISPTPSDEKTRVFVKFKNKPNFKTLHDVRKTGADIQGSFTNSTVTVYEVGNNPEKTITDLKANPNIEFVVPVSEVHAFKVTNDSYKDSQWGLNLINVEGNGQTAWDKVTSSGDADLNNKTAQVKVAVIDSGVIRNHPDLAGKFSSTPTDYVVCDDSGCTPDGNDLDVLGHGTHVAGIIAATPNNSKGIAGVGWGVKLMSVRVFDATQKAYADGVLNGIRYAADHDAKIINLSLGILEGQLGDTPEEIRQQKGIIQEAVDYAWEKGALLVAAAGNCGKNTQGVPACEVKDSAGNKTYLVNPKIYPAASNHVISVAAVGPDNTLAWYSEYNGPGTGSWVSVAAPGGDCTTDSQKASNCIISTFASNKSCSNLGGYVGATSDYCYLKGTSQASPHVAGLAALLLATNSHLTNDQLKTIIESSSLRQVNVASGAVNNGLVDALSAVNQVVANNVPTVVPTTAPTAVPTTGSTTGTPAPTRIPTATPTSGPTPTPRPTSYPMVGAKGLLKPLPNPLPNPPFCPANGACPKKNIGDANCDGVVNDADYKLWYSEYDTMYSGNAVGENANFSCKEGNAQTYFVDLIDFETWRRYTTSGLITPVPTGQPTIAATATPAISNTPVPPTATPRPTSPPDPYPICHGRGPGFDCTYMKADCVNEVNDKPIDDCPKYGTTQYFCCNQNK